jgi:hypothetical protein
LEEDIAGEEADFDHVQERIPGFSLCSLFGYAYVYCMCFFCSAMCIEIDPRLQAYHAEQKGGQHHGDSPPTAHKTDNSHNNGNSSQRHSLAIGAGHNNNTKRTSRRPSLEPHTPHTPLDEDGKLISEHSGLLHQQKSKGERQARYVYVCTSSSGILSHLCRAMSFLVREQKERAEGKEQHGNYRS